MGGFFFFVGHESRVKIFVPVTALPTKDLHWARPAVEGAWRSEEGHVTTSPWGRVLIWWLGSQQWLVCPVCPPRAGTSTPHAGRAIHSSAGRQCEDRPRRRNGWNGQPDACATGGAACPTRHRPELALDDGGARRRTRHWAGGDDDCTRFSAQSLAGPGKRARQLARGGLVVSCRVARVQRLLASARCGSRAQGWGGQEGGRPSLCHTNPSRCCACAVPHHSGGQRTGRGLWERGIGGRAKKQLTLGLPGSSFDDGGRCRCLIARVETVCPTRSRGQGREGRRAVAACCLLSGPR